MLQNTTDNPIAGIPYIDQASAPNEITRKLEGSKLVLN